MTIKINLKDKMKKVRQKMKVPLYKKPQKIKKNRKQSECIFILSKNKKYELTSIFL